MLDLNVTLALLSTLSNTGDYTCTKGDIRKLFPPTINSPIQMFRCLVIDGTPMPDYCTNEFYTFTSSGCISCTFSTLRASYLSCFHNCSTDASSLACQACTQAYLADWQSTCAPGSVIDQIHSPPATAPACASSSFVATGGVDVMATELTNCLSTNATRSDDCMASEGYTSLPLSCSDCLFSTQDVADSICTSVCAGRPYSGMCQKCISSFVSTSVGKCFQYTGYSLSLTPACTNNDLLLIGANSTRIPDLITMCKNSIDCGLNHAGLVIDSANGQKITDTCIECLSTGESLSNDSCSAGGTCGEAVIDCSSSPITQAIAEVGSCSMVDMSLMSPGSSTIQSIDQCLYTNGGNLSGCFTNSSYFSANCTSCIIEKLPTYDTCTETACLVGAGDTNTTLIPSTECQTCLVDAYTNSFLTCFSTGSVIPSCTMDQAVNIAKDTWSNSIFQRCVLANPGIESATNCLTTSGITAKIESESNKCNKCLVSSLNSTSTPCLSECQAHPDSADCRECTTLMLPEITKLCTVNTTLAMQNSDMSKDINYSNPTDLLMNVIIALISVILITQL